MDVNGFSTAGGPNANIDQQTVGSLSLLNPLKNTGKFVVGWNFDHNGETDFVSNRGSGNVGGFNLLDLDNNGFPNVIARFKTNFVQINGISGAGIPAGQMVLINAAGALGTINSSRRYKEDITDMGDASSGLMRLRPVTFRYKKQDPDGSKPLDYGLIAEEVEEVYPDLVVKDKDGQVQTVQYQKLTPMLLNEVQKEHQHVQQQDETVRLQHEQIVWGQEQNRKLEARLAALEALMSNKTAGAAGQ
jgi:hypothetical protein